MLLDYGLKAFMGPARNDDPKAALQAATTISEDSNIPLSTEDNYQGSDYAYKSSEQASETGVRITDQQTGEDLSVSQQKRRRSALDVMGTSVRVLYCTSWSYKGNFLNLKKYIETIAPEVSVEGGEYPPGTGR